MGATISCDSQGSASTLEPRIIVALDESPVGYLSNKISIALITATGYYLGTKLGFALTPPQSPISTLWPPNAILLGILLLISFRNWWVALLVVLPIHLLIQLRVGVPLTTSVGWFIGNVSEALLGAALVRRFTDPRRMFESVRGTLIFLAFAVIAAPLATTFLDAAIVILTGRSQDYWLIWTERLLSNCLEELIFAPIIVTTLSTPLSLFQSAKPVRYLEALALGAGLFVTSFLAFGFSHPQFHDSPALIYFPLSLLVWAAFRFGALGLGISLLAISVISIEGALHGTGSFAFGPEGHVLSLQILLSTAAVPLVILHALITERKQAGDAVANLSGRLIAAQEEERSRIAREIHDDYQQRLALLANDLDMLSREVGDLSGDANRRIHQLWNQISELGSDMHSLSHQLHSSTLENLGLTAGIRAFCHEFEEHQGLHITLTSSELPRTVPPDLALCLFRVAQEALRNVVRHSGANHADVKLEWDGRKLRLVVSDSGKGFDPKSRSTNAGIGIRSMEERLRLLGGQLQLHSQPSHGTRIEASVLLPNQIAG